MGLAPAGAPGRRDVADLLQHLLPVDRPRLHAALRGSARVRGPRLPRICPYSESPFDLGTSAAMLVCFVLLSLLVFVGVCYCAWRFDGESKQQDMKASQDENGGLALDPSMQAEFARSWLESRPMKTLDAVKRDAVKHGY